MVKEFVRQIRMTPLCQEEEYGVWIPLMERFLRGRIEGGQYCIALALLEDGVPVVSVLGCPNQPMFSSRTSKLTAEQVNYGTWSEDEVYEAVKQSSGVNEMQNLFSFNRGCIFVAVRGCGCYEISIRELEQSLFGSSDNNGTPMWKQLQVTPSRGTSRTPSCAMFCLGVEREFSDPKGTVLKIAQLLHGEDALTTVDGIPDIRNAFRMDGQGKYGILARGEAEYFLRLPKPDYRDWVWDVAAGYLILTEAGGKMTDVNGENIDFSGIGVDRMAKLSEDVKGLLGSCGGIFHDTLLSAYASVKKS
ncbi:hypothetical protein HJC23_006592 [Cyclotella cryptica]|uniref:3'(2'),5'-bisphosphate nucleotidase n=1 Tax=Cyclotella cryptica TaxID=29204 RepID=A0ABD3QWQ8_9STRA